MGAYKSDLSPVAPADSGAIAGMFWGVVKLNGELGNSFAMKILDS